MSRLRWPDSTNSVSDDPGTVQSTATTVTSKAASTNCSTGCQNDRASFCRFTANQRGGSFAGKAFTSV